MSYLRVVDWQTGLQKISLTKALQEHLGLTLTEAKDATDNVLKGKVVSFTLEDETKAEHLRETLENLGAVIEISDAVP